MFGSLYKLYVGNLNPGVNEGTLRGVFQEHAIEVSHIVLKRNYAFVDCPDQANVDRAIDKLNGFTLKGFAMQVEPPMAKRSRKTNKVVLRNISPHVTRDDIERFASACGSIQKCEQVGAEGVVYVTFDDPDSAQQAVNQLNGVDLNGSQVQVDYVPFRPFRKNRMGDGIAGLSGNGGPPRGSELPLRILVRSEFIGAVIGRDGKTIQKLTQDSKARVDIHRKENQGQAETMITIKGSPENCTDAAREIMKIVHTEAQALSKGNPQNPLSTEFPWRMLCPNHLCGRIIGKGGKVIQSIMQQTDTNIVVSNLNECHMPMNNYYADRVITITGSLDNSANAEDNVSERMRRYYEMDANKQQQQQQQPPLMSFPPGMPPFGMMPGFGGYPQMRPPYPPPYMGGGWYPGNMYNQMPMNQPPLGPPAAPQEIPEVTYMYIPEQTVGAVIGGKGSNIKSIMRLSNARIKILSTKDSEPSNGDKPSPHVPAGMRKVIITGNSESQWKAQFYIYEKVRNEGSVNEEMHLKTEVMVPLGSVGRIIGKRGQNLHEMQRVSGAVVNMPDTKNWPEDEEEVPVQVIGHFFATQSAQRRIRSLITGSHRGGNGGGGGPGLLQGPPLPPPPPPHMNHNGNHGGGGRRRPPPQQGPPPPGGGGGGPMPHLLQNGN